MAHPCLRSEISLQLAGVCVTFICTPLPVPLCYQLFTVAVPGLKPRGVTLSYFIFQVSLGGQVGLHLAASLPQPPGCWGHWWAPPRLNPTCYLETAEVNHF